MMLVTGDDDGGGGSGVFRLNMNHYQSSTSIVIPSQYYYASTVQPFIKKRDKISKDMRENRVSVGIGERSKTIRLQKIARRVRKNVKIPYSYRAA